MAWKFITWCYIRLSAAWSLPINYEDRNKERRRKLTVKIRKIKRQLAGEGLFDSNRKQALPILPQKIESSFTYWALYVTLLKY